MLNTKILFAAASLAVLTAMGLGSASAQPWDHRGYDRHYNNNHGRYDQRHAYVDRFRIHQALRHHRFGRVSEPFFFHGRYVVRTHDRFGRVALVQVDPYSGRFIRRL
ncbi:MAG: hypothetical protein RL274_572 [Pseudomonadota bacterium]|jgi:hypothetical protein